MAEKTKINDHGDVVFSEEDAIDLLYTDPDFDISKLYFNSTQKYSKSLEQLGIDLPVIKTAPNREKLEIFDKYNREKWHMPAKYYQINVLQWLLDKCQNDRGKNSVVQMEYDLFVKEAIHKSTTVPDLFR